VKTSVAGLARRFKVSRTHVLRLLRAAEREGHIKRTGDHYDAIVLQPHLAGAALNLFATMYLFLDRGVRAAKASVPA
jgi:DNA-binding Lrp family transcriptional regulator